MGWSTSWWTAPTPNSMPGCGRSSWRGGGSTPSYAATAGEIERRGSYLDDGHRSITAYLRATCNWSDAEAKRMARLTDAVAVVPCLLEALHELTFRRFCELEHEADVAARRDTYGDDAELHVLPRTPSQRGYDALVAIMRHATANLDAGRQPRTADWLVNVLVDHRTFGSVLAAAGLTPDATSLAGEALDPFTGLPSPHALLADLVDDADLASRRCETASGVVLHPHAVLRAALAGWCQVDHSTEWHEHGTTDQRNAGVECSGHNREKHRKTMANPP